MIDRCCCDVMFFWTLWLLKTNAMCERVCVLHNVLPLSYNNVKEKHTIKNMKVSLRLESCGKTCFYWQRQVEKNENRKAKEYKVYFCRSNHEVRRHFLRWLRQEERQLPGGRCFFFFFHFHSSNSARRRRNKVLPLQCKMSQVSLNLTWLSSSTCEQVQLQRRCCWRRTGLLVCSHREPSLTTPVRSQVVLLLARGRSGIHLRGTRALLKASVRTSKRLGQWELISPPTVFFPGVERNPRARMRPVPNRSHYIKEKAWLLFFSVWCESFLFGGGNKLICVTVPLWVKARLIINHRLVKKIKDNLRR